MHRKRQSPAFLKSRRIFLWRLFSSGKRTRTGKRHAIVRNAGGEADARTSQALVRPRSSGNWSFRKSANSVASQLPVPAPERRHRNSKAEIRRVRKLGGTILVVHAEGPPAARAGIRSVGVSGSRIVLEKDGSVLEFPKQPTHTSGSSPRKHPLLRKPENGKLPDIVPACVPARTEILNRPAKTEPSDNRRIATNKNGRTKIGLGVRPFRRGERIPRSAKKPGGRYGTKLGSFTSRRPDEGKIAIILSWYVSCI